MMSIILLNVILTSIFTEEEIFIIPDEALDNDQTMQYAGNSRAVHFIFL